MKQTACELCKEFIERDRKTILAESESILKEITTMKQGIEALVNLWKSRVATINEYINLTVRTEDDYILKTLEIETYEIVIKDLQSLLKER